MGFGLISIGVMFLFDQPIYRTHPGETAPYMMIDLFPDAIGWVLLLLGLYRLSRKKEEFLPLFRATAFFLPASVLLFFSETLFFPSFYPDFTALRHGAFPTELLNLLLHLGELLFLFFLFRRTEPLAEREDQKGIVKMLSFGKKLILACVCLSPIVFLFDWVAAGEAALKIRGILAAFNNLSFVVTVWLGLISFLRCDLKISE